MGSYIFVAKTPQRNNLNVQKNLIPKRPKIGEIGLRKGSIKQCVCYFLRQKNHLEDLRRMKLLAKQRVELAQALMELVH